MSQNLYDLIGLAAGICFILALKGLSSPKSARRGNAIGAVGATIATVIVFFHANEGRALNHLPVILGAIAFGVLVGVPAARRVPRWRLDRPRKVHPGCWLRQKGRVRLAAGLSRSC